MPSRSADFPENSILLLKADHHELLGRFDRFFALRNPPARQQAWRVLRQALKRHLAIEAELFYPAYLDATEDSLTHFVASVGHENIAAEMQDLSEESSASDQFVSRVRTLKKTFVNHVADMEKNGGMFELAGRSTIHHEILTQLIRARYAALETAAEEGTTVDRAPVSL